MSRDHRGGLGHSHYILCLFSRTPKSQAPAGSTRGTEHPSAQRPMLRSWWCLVARGLCLHPRAWPPLQRAGAPELPGEARGSCSVHTACSASATSRARSSSDTWPTAACEPGGGQAGALGLQQWDPEMRAEGALVFTLVPLGLWNRGWALGPQALRPGLE